MAKILVISERKGLVYNDICQALEMYGHVKEEVADKKDIRVQDLANYDAIVIDDMVGDVEFPGSIESLRQTIGEKVIFTALGPAYISAEREERYRSHGVKRFVVKDKGDGMPIPASCNGSTSHMLMQKIPQNRPEYCVNIIYCLRDMLNQD